MNGLLLFVGVIFFLWLGRPILIPLFIAMFLWYLVNAIATYYRKIMPFKPCTYTATCTPKSKVFDYISLILAVLTLCEIVYLFITQIQPMFRELIFALPEIQERLIDLGRYLSGLFGYKLDMSLVPNLTQTISRIGMSAAQIATATGMVFVYILFLFMEQRTFRRKFVSLFPGKRQSKKMYYILNSIDENMKKYLFMKTALSAATGIFSYIWLQVIGLNFAGVWAFIIFITCYIPTIGPIVACTLPIIYALATSGNLHLVILTAAGLIGMQVLFNNILEPKLTGQTLNLSTLAILINLVFWGLIWGIAGMFFSVPLLVAIFVVTAQFDSTRWIAVLLSADGNIPDKRDEDD